jgi:hypothetical protein
MLLVERQVRWYDELKTSVLTFAFVMADTSLRRALRGDHIGWHWMRSLCQSNVTMKPLSETAL